MSAPRWISDMPLQRPEGVADDAVVRVLRVPPEGAGSRVDVFLSHALRGTSRTRAKLIAQNSAFCPTGRRLKASERLPAESLIALWRDPVDDQDPELQLPILFEDEHLLVINKPAQLTVHPTARHYHATVIRILQGLRPDEKLNLVHRLDKDTSGVLLLARTVEADRAFKRVFEGIVAPPGLLGLAARRLPPGTCSHRKRLVEKTYFAICWQQPPDGLLDTPLEPDTDNCLRVKMRIAQPGQGLPASTVVKVLDQCPGYSFVQCTLLTGRQHQIRVHLASVGAPVVGDKLYGPDDQLLARAADGTLTLEDRQLLELPRQALHAARYRLRHALTGQDLDLSAPLSEDLVEFWQRVARRAPPIPVTGKA